MAKSFGAKEIQDVLDATDKGETIQLKLRQFPYAETKWLSITREQAVAIQAILEED